MGHYKSMHIMEKIVKMCFFYQADDDHYIPRYINNIIIELLNDMFNLLLISQEPVVGSGTKSHQ